MPRIFHRTDTRINSPSNGEPVQQVYRPFRRMVRDNFFGGIAWAIGATVGLAFFVGVITFILSLLGGLPVVGSFFANIVDGTNQALQRR